MGGLSIVLTLMNSNLDDLIGSIITSDKPLAVFSGHQCGTPTDDGTLATIL